MKFLLMFLVVFLQIILPIDGCFYSEMYERIDEFYEENFSQYHVIGIYYRDIDVVPYETVDYVLKRVLGMQCAAERPIKIFIVTNDPSFIDHERLVWGNEICYHLMEDEITGMMLISKCEFIISTNSKFDHSNNIAILEP